MALAYSPGLKRKEFYIITKTRRLPISGEVLVKQGGRVSYDSIVARTSVPGKPRTYNACYYLGCEPSELKSCMVKNEGDPIAENDVLAIKKGFFGWGKRTCQSPYTGTIEYISPSSGQIIIREPPVPVEVTAYIPGTVSKIIPKEGTVIETSATYIQGIFGVGGETHGVIKVKVNSPNDVLTSDLIDDEDAGKVLVGGSLVKSAALKKGVEVGVKGIVVGGIAEQDLTDFVGYEIGVAITGHEQVGLTLVVTEGFGRMNMAQKTFELLKKLEGKFACFNGATQIRAGVIRPEIIIPIEKVDAKGLRDSGIEHLTEGMRPGLPIRIIREPYFGAVGRVAELPPELQKVETESHVRILIAELDDGRRVTVPRANVELIEE